MDLPSPFFFFFFAKYCIFPKDQLENASFPQPSSVHSKLDKLYNPLASLAEGSSWDCSFPSLPQSLCWKIRLRLDNNFPLFSTLCVIPVENSSSPSYRTPCLIYAPEKLSHPELSRWMFERGLGSLIPLGREQEKTTNFSGGWIANFSLQTLEHKGLGKY